MNTAHDLNTPLHAPSAMAQNLRALLQPVALEMNLHMAHIHWHASKQSARLEILLENADHTPALLDDITRASKMISRELDVAEENDDISFPSRYKLEVSSPGVERQLYTRGDIQRHRSKTVKVKRVGETVKGKLLSYDDMADTITLEGIEAPIAIATMESIKTVMTDDDVRALFNQR